MGYLLVLRYSNLRDFCIIVGDAYEEPLLRRADYNISPCGRGNLTKQFGVRGTFFLPEYVNQQHPDLFPHIDDHEIIKQLCFDRIDCNNMPPVIGQVLSRMPGQNIPYNSMWDISRATGYPTVRDSVCGLDVMTVIKNGLWCDWARSPPKSWAVQHVDRFLSMPNKEARAKAAAAHWSTLLRGSSGITSFRFRGIVGLGDSIRERLATVYKFYDLKAAADNTKENEDLKDLSFEAFMAVSRNCKNDAVNSRIEKFLNDPEPVFKDDKKPLRADTTLLFRSYRHGKNKEDRIKALQRQADPMLKPFTTDEFDRLFDPYFQEDSVPLENSESESTGTDQASGSDGQGICIGTVDFLSEGQANAHCEPNRLLYR